MVKRLINIELQKVLSYNFFKVLAAMYLGLFILCVLIFPQIELNLSFREDVDLLDIKSFYTFPVIWNAYAWLASKFNILLAIMVIFLVGNEYSFGTFRQHIVDGLSKTELISAKFIVIVLIAIGSIITISLSSIIMGLIYSDEISISLMFQNLPVLLVFLVQACAYMSMAMFIVIMVKNKTVSIVIFLSYSVIIEPLLRLLIRKYIWADIVSYFPAKIIFKLTPVPENGLISFIRVNAESEGLFGKSLPLYQNLIIAVLYCALFVFFSYRILKKRNL